jgi:hypothetical protein
LRPAIEIERLMTKIPWPVRLPIMAPSNGRGIDPELSGDLPSTTAPTSGGIVEPRAGPARALWARGHGRRQSSTFHAAGRLMRWTDEASTRTERRSFAHRAPG